MNEPPLRRLPTGELVPAWPRRPWWLRLLDWIAVHFCTRHTAGGLLLVVAVVVTVEKMTHTEGKS